MPVLRSWVSWVAVCALLGAPACQRDESPPAAPGAAASQAGAPPAPERNEDLAALVSSLVDSIQAKQSSFVLDHLSPQFKEEGGLDYYDVRALVEKYTLAPGIVGARLEQSALAPEAEGRQRAVSHVAFASGQRLGKGEPLPPGAVVYLIEVVFAKSGAKWQAVGGRYKRELPPVTSPATLSMNTR
jgi:hypothetical protein